MVIANSQSQQDLFSINCNLCQSSKNRLVSKKNGYQIVRCSNCGLIYVSPRVSVSYIYDLYKKNKSSSFDYYCNLEKIDKERFKKLFSEINKYKKSGIVLDFGCATGSFLQVAKEYGYQTHGVEINSLAVEWTRNVLGLNILEGTMSRFSYKEDFFDIVHMGDVIEHLEDPLSALKLVNIFMQKKGLLIITTPNFNSILTKMFQVKPEEHLYYFNKVTLRKLIELSGFKVLFIKGIDKIKSIEALKFSSTFSSNNIFRLLFNVFGRTPLNRMNIKFPFQEDLLAFAFKK